MKSLFCGVLLVALMAVNVVCAQNQNRRNNPDAPRVPFVHDPVMAKYGDTYYLYCTGNGISVMSSKDMVNWKQEKPVFDTPPAWAVEAVPGYKGHTWAPDIIYHNGKYHIFYSVSAFGKNTSCIGRAENVTLDVNSPDYKWVDHGKIIQSVPNRDMWNAIDPNIIVDQSGTPWMNFGSFWDGIKMVKMKKDLTAIAQPEEWYSLSCRTRKASEEDTNPGSGAVEAPFIFKKGNYYYLFVSFDFCCRGAESTYKVVVGRSEDVKGPYFDKDGVPMAQGGGTLVVQGNSDWAGVGHNSTYTFNDKDYLIFHGYNNKMNGAPNLIVREIEWDAAGWPIVKL